MPTVAQEEYFKNTKIRNEDGSLMKVYHGSPNTFEAFDKNWVGRIHGESCGSGFNFTPDKEYAEMLATGKNGMLVEAYVNITKPLSSDEFTLTKDDVVDIVETLVSHFRDYSWDAFSEAEIESLTENLFEFYDEKVGTVWANDAQLLTEIEDQFKNKLSELENFSDILENYVNEHSEEIAETYDEELDEYYFNEYEAVFGEVKATLNDYVYGDLGYDGFVGTSFNGSKVYVCLEPNQVKATDNLFPTKSNNFKDNSKEYFQEKGISPMDAVIKTAQAKKENKLEHKQYNKKELER